MISGSTRYARQLGFFGGLGAATGIRNPVLAPKSYVPPFKPMPFIIRKPDYYRPRMEIQPLSPVYPDGEDIYGGGGVLDTTDRGRFLRGLGAKEEVNAFEKIFGINVTPDPESGDYGGGLRLITRPSTFLGAIIGGFVGGAIGPGKGKNYLTSTFIGAGIGMAAFGLVGAARSKGW